jgi:hypothetical protein
MPKELLNEKEIEDILERGLRLQGPVHQFRSAQEEAAELIVAINHMFRGRVDIDKVIEELNDVKMMCMMLEKIINEPAIVEKAWSEKWKKYKDYLDSIDIDF